MPTSRARENLLEGWPDKSRSPSGQYFLRVLLFDHDGATRSVETESYRGTTGKEQGL
jgi:hypothetical protein